MDTRLVAERFVDLAIKYREVKVRELAPDEVEILVELLRAAAFTFDRVVPGKSRGFVRDRGYDVIDEYVANEFCQFVVMSGREENTLATRWLYNAWEHVFPDRIPWKRPSRGQLVEEVVKAIAASIPLEPIQLTSEGDFLKESSEGDHVVFGKEHTRDSHVLRERVGLHAYCGHFIYHGRVTEGLDVLVCRACCLRVLIPHGIKTYGELRQYLAG